jgi:predicted transcriptional regulator of viral defense system
MAAARSGIKPDRLPDELLSEGVSTFDTAEAARRTGLSRERVHGALKRLADAGEIFSAARGFYVIVPPEYRSWGAVPASWFVDPMMAHLGRSYYVGLLSAAELLGASHQRPQVFQVVVDKYLPGRAFGRVRLQFVVNKYAGKLATTAVNSPTGMMRASTPEVTALDLANRPLDSGGLSNVATVLIELYDDRQIIEAGLVDAAAHYPSASVRRAGYLLERFADLRLDALHRFARPEGHEPAPFDASGPRQGPVERRWNLRLNTEIEPDLDPVSAHHGVEPPHGIAHEPVLPGL